MNLKRKFKMKKTAIALTVAALVATSVQAAPQANSFYTGAKAGWATYHDGINQFDNKDKADDYRFKTKRSSVAYGVFGGYQITNNFAVELGYDYFGKVKGTNRENAKEKISTESHGAQLTLKASYPVLKNLDVYARAGAALVRSSYKATKTQDGNKLNLKSTKVSPVFAGGLEYAFTPALAARLEYQWVRGVGKVVINNSRFDFTPSIGAVTAGISYRFGQTPMMVPEVVNKEFKLKSDVLFAYNKADLKAEAKAELDSIYAEIAPLKSVSVDVAGYTDYLGSGNYNLALSQRRADTVANYLASKGVVAEAITATGYGEANPVKAPQCESVKGRKALIACLAEDRRVEISVKGTK